VARFCAEKTRAGLILGWVWFACGFLFGFALDRLQFLTWFEAHGFAGRNANFFACAGIAAYAGFAGLHIEDAEAAEFDALAAAHGIFQGFEDGFDCTFRVTTLNVGVGDHGVHYVQLNHNFPPGLKSGDLC
jgi:hypothetical protein